jgi:ubiquinone biosynthesis protein
MVMEEGVATWLYPDINMWETSEPFLREWVRSELGPEAALADRLVRDFRTLANLPELIRRIEARYPPPGAAPPPPPLPDIMIVQPRRYGFSLLLAGFSAAAGAIAALLLS